MHRMPGTAIVIGVGAEAGLGAALARRFAREGLHVCLAARRAERIEALASALRAAGGAASAFATDATVPAEVGRLFDAAERAGGPPELVAYNAGNASVRPLLETSEADFEAVWRLGCFGGFLAGREAARRMLPRGSGSILFTGATASLRARPPFTAFAAAKAGLRALAHGMAREFGPQGLHVAHVVIDGVIDGDQVNRRMPQLKERLGADGMLAPDAIADAYWQLHAQPKSAWTLELDLRPWKETF
jgi:NAD(P)-dependent dehydrogenase (short-subunit alcohol dehydrogenase family)